MVGRRRSRLAASVAEIRSGRRTDVEAVLALWRAAYDSSVATSDTVPAVERLLGDDPGALLVAETDGSVVGTLIAAWDGWRGNMYRLAVHPDHRRAGLARQLIGRGETRLRECAPSG